MSLRWAIRGVLLAALAPAGLVACGGSDDGSGARPAAATAAPAPTAQPASAQGPATVGIGRSRLGRILVDANGRSLYFFTQDKPEKARCTADYLGCTKIWQPLMTSGRPHGAAGVEPGLLASFHRTKPAGSQVSYHGHPVYLYLEDKQPGDLKGQGLYTYWYVLSPGGRPIMSK
jgi:predicted lipoprotein with Yx(FWY)xxD motif